MGVNLFIDYLLPQGTSYHHHQLDEYLPAPVFHSCEVEGASEPTDHCLPRGLQVTVASAPSKDPQEGQTAAASFAVPIEQSLQPSL